MYRLLATDIDDTILAADGSLPEANRSALITLHDRGVAVVFSSGRADVSTRRLAARILPPDEAEFLIAFNGARTVRALDGSVVTEHMLSPETVARIAAYARHQELVLHAYAGEEFLAERKSAESDTYAQATQMEYRVVADLATAVGTGSPKLLAIADHEVLLEHQQALNELARDGTGGGGASRAARAPAFEALFSKPHYLEIVPSGVTKGSALDELCVRLGIPISESIAIGDSLNDISMIQAAGLGVAVANARDEVKRAADVVLSRSADEGAIEELVMRFFDDAAAGR